MGNENSSVAKYNYLETPNFDKNRVVKELRKMAAKGQLYCEKTSADTVSQWVENVTRYSSQYDSQRWCADQVIGSPKVYPAYGDKHGAWAMQKKDAHQFLEIEYKEPVYVTGIDIYETYHAGGVTAVKALNDEGKWHMLWKADKPTVIKSSRIFSPPLAGFGCRTRNIRVEVNCTACNSWVEIDAIHLHGRKYLADQPPSVETLATDLAQLVNDSRFSDCQFLLEGKHTVYAHRAIISARSHYFKAMFSDMTKESSSQTAIEIKEVSLNSFMAVLHYLYTNNIPSNVYPYPPYDSIALTDVWRVADRFSLEGLKKLAVHLISIKIGDSNVVDTYIAATDTLPVIDEVKNNCILYMSTNLSNIVNTASFTTLPQDVMLEIIQGTTAKLRL